MEVLQWLLAGVAVVSAAASFGAYLLSRKKDDRETTTTAAQVANAVTSQALEAQAAALDRAERDIKHLLERVKEIGPLKDQVAVLSRSIERCEEEKAGLADRVRELESAQ